MVTHSKQIPLRGSSHWQRGCQHVPAVGGRAGERARLPFWSLSLKQCVGCRKKHPHPADNALHRSGARGNEVTILTDTVPILIQSHVRQTPIIIPSGFLPLSVNPPQTAVSFTMSSFHNIKGRQPIPTSLCP